MFKINASKDWAFIIAVSSAVIPGIMSTAMLALAFTNIAESFDISYQVLQWRNVIFFSVFAISILYFSSTVSTFGAKRLIVTAQLVFVVSAVVSASTSNWLIFTVAQGFQALADGMMVPSQMSLIRNKISKDRWGWAFGWFHGTLAIGGLSGPILGAFLIEHFGWRSIPAVLGVIQLLIFAVSVYVLDRDQTEQPSAKPPLISALLLFGVLCCAQSALTFSGNDQNTTAFLISLAALGLSCVLFILVERILLLRARQTLVPWESLKHFKFAMALLRIFLVFVVANAIGLHLPTALLAVSDISITTIGMLLTFGAVLSALFEPVLGRLADRWGGFCIAGGLGIMTVATSLYLLIGQWSAALILLIASTAAVLAGALFGPAQLRDASLAASASERDRFMGFYMFCQFISGAFAASIFGSILEDKASGGVSLHTFHLFIASCSALLGIATLTALVSGVRMRILGYAKL